MGEPLFLFAKKGKAVPPYPLRKGKPNLGKGYQQLTHKFLYNLRGTLFSRKNKVPRTPPTKPKLGFFISGLNKYIFNIIYNQKVNTVQERRRRDV